MTLLELFSSTYAGIVSVVIILSTAEFYIFSNAFPVNKVCVAYAYTFLAPFAFSSSTVALNVVAVSIKSSIIITFFP